MIFNTLSLAAILLIQVSAQDSTFRQLITTLPSCGQTCLTTILTKATSEFNCPATDIPCLCGRTNFKYAIRDCVNTACSSSDATNVISLSNNVCAAEIKASSAGSSVVVISSATTSLIGFSSSSSDEPAVVPTTYTSDGSTYTTRLTTNRAGGGLGTSTTDAAAPVGLTTIVSGTSTQLASLSRSTSLTTYTTDSSIVTSASVTTSTEPLVVVSTIVSTVVTEPSTTVTRVMTNVETVVATTVRAFAAATQIPIVMAGLVAGLMAMGA